MEAALGDVAMTVDGAEHRSRLDLGFLEPAPQRADRARRRVLPERNADLAAARRLIRLRTPQVDDEPVLRVRDIGVVDCRELRPAKRAGEADQDERTIAAARKTLRT